MSENSTARIVVGVDGSPSSIEALRWARTIAGPTGATIDAVAVWDLPTMYSVAYLPADYTPEDDSRTTLNDAVDTALGSERPEGVRLIVQKGYAAEVLLENSVGALMLIVGSRGHGGFAGLLLGSVSAHCAEHAPVPVLVVHGQMSAGAGAAHRPSTESASSRRA